MQAVTLWSLGARCLQVHTDGGERVAVLLDGGRVVGLWRLPRRTKREHSRVTGSVGALG